MKRQLHITSGIPLLPFTVLYAAGVAFSPLFQTIYVWVGLAVIITALLLSKRVILGTWIAAFLLGNIGASICRPQPDVVQSVYESSSLSGYIESVAENDFGTVATVSLSTPGIFNHVTKVKIIVPAFDKNIEEGMEISFKGKIRPVTQYADIPYETDYSSYDKNKGILATGYLSADSIISLQQSSSLKGRMARLRTSVKNFILQSPFDSQLKEFLVAVLLGDASLITSDTRQSFSDAGLSHILALSGLHIALITSILSLALWPMVSFGIGKWRSLPIILLLWGYALFTGLSPSVTRAVIMATVYMIGLLAERRSSPYNSLCFAALLILIFRPYDLFDIGFQLSFAAVLSILLFANDLNPVNQRKRWLYNAFGYITVSISAVIGTFVISAYYFHSIPLNFLPANLIAALVFPLILTLSLVTLLLHVLNIDIAALYNLCDWIYTAFRHVIETILYYGPHAVRGIYFSAWCLIPVAVAIAALKMWITRRKTVFAGIMLASVLSFFALQLSLSGHHIAPHLYVSRHGQRTDLIIDAADSTMHIFTTRPNEPITVVHDASSRYRDFIARQSIDSIHVISQPVYRHRSFIINHRVLTFPSFSLAIISGQPLQRAAVNYTLICNGYRSDIEQILQYNNPDTVILSTDLNPHVLKKLMAQCDSLGIPHISLHNRPWSRAL